MKARIAWIGIVLALLAPLAAGAETPAPLTG